MHLFYLEIPPFSHQLRNNIKGIPSVSMGIPIKVVYYSNPTRIVYLISANLVRIP